MAKKAAEPDPSGRRPAPGEPARRESARGAPAGSEAGAGIEQIPTRLVVVAYALALLCAVAPLAVLGAGFAGAVLFKRGRRGAGAGVVALAVLCAALGVSLLR